MSKAQTVDQTQDTPTPAKQAETIQMEDGSKVTFPASRKLHKEASITAQGAIKIRLCFRNGAVVEEIFLRDHPIYTQAAAHGLLQKLGDECAGVKDLDDQVQGVKELLVRLNNGEFKGKRDGTGSAAGSSILARALAIINPAKTPEEIKNWLATKSQGEKLALRGNPKVKAVIDQLEAERAKKAGEKAPVDTDALLADLDSVTGAEAENYPDSDSNSSGEDSDEE